MESHEVLLEKAEILLEAIREFKDALDAASDDLLT